MDSGVNVEVCGFWRGKRLPRAKGAVKDINKRESELSRRGSIEVSSDEKPTIPKMTTPGNDMPMVIINRHII